MSDKEILEKAITKAIENGWDWLWKSYLEREYVARVP